MKNAGTILRTGGVFERLATLISRITGTTMAFTLAVAMVIFWAISGPAFHFSEDWQLVINTTTSIITFLMVFLIQKAQNKDSLAIQLKLDELVAANELASNRLVNVEGMTEDELRVIQKYYSRLSEITQKGETLRQSHSIDGTSAQQQLREEMENELKIKLRR